MKKFYNIYHFCVALLSVLCALTLSVSAAYADAPTKTEQTEIAVPADHQVEAAQVPDGVDIIGGTEAQIGEFPWQVFLQVDLQNDGTFQFCGGSLIHPEWVLTAAHCIGQRSHTVFLGAHNWRNDTNYQRISASSTIIVHDRYSSTNYPNRYDNDIALIKLSRPATLNNRVAVVPLITASGQDNLISVGTNSTVAGWGTTRSNRTQPSDVLLKANVSFVSNQTCQSYDLRVTNNMLCAGFANGGRDFCGGDSGGALIVQDSSGRRIQAGIVSWAGNTCAQRGFYGVYTRVSNYIDWIKQYVPLNSTPTPVPSGDRYESDDTQNRAKSISINGNRQTHNIHRNNDVDWLKFNTVRGQKYVVETLNLGSHMDTQIWVYDPNQNYLYNDDISNTNQASRISFIAAQSSTHYIAIEHYDDAVSGANTNYDIRVRTVTSTPSGDRYENDDTPSQAKSISTDGSRQTHNIHRNGDLDWLKFNTVRGRTYVVETLSLGSRMDTRLWVYDPSNNYLYNDDISNSNRASRVSFIAEQNGTHYIAVRHHNNSISGANTSYDVRVRTVSSTPSGDAFEVDNQFRQARSISTNNGRQNHNFHARNDIDWVKFSVRSGYIYVVDTLSLESRADTVIYLYNSSGKVLLSSDNYRGKRSRLRFRVNRNMTLYLKVKQTNGNIYGQNTGYTLRARTFNGYSGANSNVDSVVDSTAELQTIEDSAFELHAIYPNSIHNRKTKSITLEGTGLDEDEIDIYLDDTLITKTLVEEDQSISILVPVGMDPGTYDITLVDRAGGRTTLTDGLVITGESFDNKIYLPLVR